MFSRCLVIASTLANTESAIIEGLGAKIHVAGMMVTAAAMDPIETFLLIRAPIRKAATMETPTRQSIMKPMAAPVAIPFPPLK